MVDRLSRTPPCARSWKDRAGARRRLLPFARADPSGDRLREWMYISKQDFYDESRIALVPMGFCPGTGKSGDLPPRSECAQLWNAPLLSQLRSVRLSLVIGQYAQEHRLGKTRKSSLTKTVQAWQEFTPTDLPLPHPSPRNNRWLVKNPWFESEVAEPSPTNQAAAVNEPTSKGDYVNCVVRPVRGERRLPIDRVSFW